VLTQAVDEQIQKVKQSSELLVQGVMNHARTEHARTEQARTEHAHTEIKQARTEHIHTEIGHVPTNGYRDFEGPHSVSQVIDEMAATMQHISEQAAKVAQVAVEAMDVTLEGQSTVDRAVDGMGQVREATMQAARVMKRLGESGQEINDTVLTITDLTTRMNLLALNAAIEAVRAGEHGQGFAVIAQEMRTLAVHSTEAARKVETRMRTIQQETATAAVSVEQNTRQVVMQTELVTQTGVALDAISVVTEQMADLVQEIAELAKRAVAKRLSIPPRTGDDSIERRLESSTTSAAPPMINRGLLALHHAPTGQSQDSRPVVDSVEGISHMTGEIAQQISQVQQSLTHLVNLIQVLRSRVSVFRI
jgi:methyl-accepting chemotaxis protein